MTKTLAEQLARFGFKSKPSTAIEAPEGFDEEVAAPEVAETKEEVVEASVSEVVEAEAPKAEEAPKTETVEEAPKTAEEPAPAQVETPAVAVEAAPAPTVTEPAKKSPKSMSRMRITNEKADVDITQIGEVKPISNRGLRKFREDNFGKNSLDTVPEEYIIDATLSKNTGIPCVWEEGGADMASGYALLVADKNGNKKAPVLCLRDQGVVNGKHALVPVEHGDLILLGVMRKRRDETQVCCVVGTVTDIIIDGKRALITMSPAACARTGLDEDIALEYANDSLEFITEDHPLLQAALTRVQEKFCHEPIYVRDYVRYTFNKVINDDLNMAFADTKFVQTLQTFDTTNAAYDAIEKIIGDRVRTATKFESVLVTSVLNINKDAQGNDCIFIYIVGAVFNGAAQVCNSQGGRFFYARVKVLPGQTFTYIDDRGTSLEYERALEQMTLEGKKWVADTVKRVTV